MPLYRSSFLYTREVYDLAEEAGSIKTFFGERAIDNILIDIDKGDNSDQYTLDKTRGLLFNLEELGLTEYNYQCYFSGYNRW